MLDASQDASAHCWPILSLLLTSTPSTCSAGLPCSPATPLSIYTCLWSILCLSVLGLPGKVLVAGWAAAGVASVAASHISRLMWRILSLLSKQVDKDIHSVLG